MCKKCERADFDQGLELQRDQMSAKIYTTHFTPPSCKKPRKLTMHILSNMNNLFSQNVKMFFPLETVYVKS